jgi:two-component system, OmpR family, sensor histidine kinase KdpD
LQPESYDSRASSVENFLKLVRKSRRGSFKIYIGLAAGVGKTYRMLTEAHELLRLGVDIVVGYVETHGRKETAEKITGLPVIPRKEIFYKGKRLEEMDLEAVLRRHPEVVIVDELAHTNVPGSKHEKRYHDVEEILSAGISVISAVNIQHIESLNQVVEKATGVEVSERIPDSVLKMADEVVNIDLTADELIKRLTDGKIYPPDKIERALTNFFQTDNLLRLRELALREVANQVERKIEDEVRQTEKKRSEKILVCISTNMSRANHLIRKAARIADRLDAFLYVAFVETSAEAPDKINLALQRHLIHSLELATELGADVQRLKGESIPDTIISFAKEKKISLIMIGRPKPTFIQRLTGMGILYELITKTRELDIDIHIIA